MKRVGEMACYYHEKNIISFNPQIVEKPNLIETSRGACNTTPNNKQGVEGCKIGIPKNKKMCFEFIYTC